MHIFLQQMWVLSHNFQEIGIGIRFSLQDMKNNVPNFNFINIKLKKKKTYIVILCYILVYTLYKLYNPFPLNKKDFYKKIMVKKVWDGSYIIFCTKMVQYHEH